MKNILSMIIKSPFVSGLLTSITNIFYGLVVGVALFPGLVIIIKTWHYLPDHESYKAIFILALSCGLSIVVFFTWGVILFGLLIRIISSGVKSGTYSVSSITMFRWLMYSGLYNIAGYLILQFIPMSFLLRIFFRLVGAKIGKNVQINTWFLNDAYLLEIGDNVVIGGKTDVSCHTFERGKLHLDKIKIGDNSAIGQHCYISPGVIISENCVIGQYSFVRKNTIIPPKTILSAIAGLPIRHVAKIEKEDTL
jgi:acetyltransferase-like isoleucine patch superfamily enzyme